MTLPRFMTSNGISYYQTGYGTPVVLLHGVGLCADCWFQQIGALGTTNAVFALDLPGHGRSTAIDNRKLALDEFTTSLHAFVEEVVAGAPIVVGHSLGAMIALDYASKYPKQCRGVAALSTIYRRSAEARFAVRKRADLLRIDDVGNVALAPVTRWFGDAPTGKAGQAAALCKAWLNDSDRSAYAAAYALFAEADAPPDDALEAMAMPALFLTGADDPNSTAAMSEAMAKLARQGTAVIVEGARHMVQMTHTDEVNAALCTLIDSCEAMPA